MKTLFFVIAFIISVSAYSQTVIKMSHPADADLVLLQVNDSSKADVIIYFTKDKKLAKKWNCMWKLKKWGFSHFSLYMTSDENDPKLYEMKVYGNILPLPEGMKIPFSAKVYITNNCEDVGYRNKDFRIPGVMRIEKSKKFRFPK
ncbi:MAG: hypothetical protein HPY57_14750 [Ignavibacteria bacterium]|nr:hypothetical protein [Ignavibacteria bacterium]